jgi:hypothetical protein
MRMFDTSQHRQTHSLPYYNMFDRDACLNMPNTQRTLLQRMKKDVDVMLLGDSPAKLCRHQC